MGFNIGDKVKTTKSFKYRSTGVTKGTKGKVIRINGPKHNLEYTVEIQSIRGDMVQIICFERELAKVGLFG